MANEVQPTERELEILKILWDRGESTVREVYEEMRQLAPIVQNTVQAFLRTMEEKGLVRHREAGRSFVYQATRAKEETSKGLMTGLLKRVFDGAVDQLVQSALSLRSPTEEELASMEAMIAKARESRNREGKSPPSREGKSPSTRAGKSRGGRGQ